MPLVKGYISQDPSSVQVAADAYIELIETENFEGCFYFEEGTVRDYAETCPRDMVIPNTIGGTPVTRI